MQKDITTLNLPVIPLRNVVSFPCSIINFEVGRKSSIEAAVMAMKTGKQLFLALQKDQFTQDPDVRDLRKTGVIAKILQLIKGTGDETVKIVVEGVTRAEIVSAERSDEMVMLADVKPVACDVDSDSDVDHAAMNVITELFYEYTDYFPRLGAEFIKRFQNLTNLSDLTDFVSGIIIIDFEEKQTLLETYNKNIRAELLIQTLKKELMLLNLQNEIKERAQVKIDENQREYFLQEQMRAIQEELGEDIDNVSEAEDFKQKILKLKLPKENEEILLKECKRLERMPMGSHEGNIVSTYLSSCLELPWNVFTKERINLDKVRSELDKNHYGLEKVKERVLELLAVKALNKDVKGQIICLVGPPGVGKTSIALSIAKAINRHSARVALGGVHDEAEIRGHRRTYIGSMCGRIINAIKQAKSCNPLIVLDEIDKLANDYKGDPTSALLEVLDSEQNSTFYDHYLDMPFDLSHVMFITTANDYYAIPAPLRDRMEVIEIDSYTREEKFHIAKEHLLPRQLKNCGIKAKNFKITDDGLYALIDKYTKESGVRSLERVIGRLLSKAAIKVVADNSVKLVIKPNNLSELLGAEKYKADTIMQSDEVGVATGLAWTSVGGEILPIEVAVMKGEGKIELTGSLGEVMQESAKTAFTCVRSRAESLGLEDDFYKTHDIHIHAPEGAVPKDGPSAGITIGTAIVSAFTGVPVNRTVAMTGEITLRGKVLPIGGLKEKTMAAYRLGIKTVIIPEDNVSDLDEVDKAVKSAIDFVPVSSFEQVLDIALNKTGKPDEKSALHEKRTRPAGKTQPAAEV